MFLLKGYFCKVNIVKVTIKRLLLKCYYWYANTEKLLFKGYYLVLLLKGYYWKYQCFFNVFLSIPCMWINGIQCPRASKHYKRTLNAVDSHAWNWQKPLMFNCSEKICTIWLVNNPLQLMLQHPLLVLLLKGYYWKVTIYSVVLYNTALSVLHWSL